MKAGLVSGEHRPVHAHAAEGTNGQTAVRLAAPWAPPVLELDDLAGSLGHERLHRVLVGQIVASADGVEGVEVRAVVLPEGGRGPSLRRDRMAPHRVHLGDECDAQAVGDLRGGDRCPQAGGPSPHDDDVVRDRFQAVPLQIRGLFYRVGRGSANLLRLAGRAPVRADRT